jgi:phospholipase/carboxylesterase
MSHSTSPLTSGVALECAAVACVFVHGRGQSPEIMQEQVLDRLVAKSVHFILPRAAKGSWYDAKAVDTLTPATRTQLALSIQGLRDIAGAVPAHIPLLLAGFSQGACLSIEYTMAYGPWRGGLVALTGCRVGSVSDDRVTSDLKAFPAYLSGSDADPWIPVAAFADAAAALASARARLRCDVIPGRAHEVASIEVAILNGALERLAAGQEVLW